MKKFATLIVALAVTVLVSNAYAVTNTETYVVSVAGNNTNELLKASATFALTNSDLVVTLANTSPSNPNDPSDILTGVFLSIAGDPKLTPVSVGLGTGSSIINFRLPQEFDGSVGRVWSYRNDLIRAPGGDNEGISSTSLKWFRPRYLFPGERLPGSGSLSGVRFGLTTLNDLPGNDDNALKRRALIDSSVVLTFSGLPSGFTLSDISNVKFQYGDKVTAASEPLGELVSVVSVPEPSTILLTVSGLATLFFVKRRK
jgi:hypothetical protein